MAAAPLGWSGRHGSFFDKKKRNNTSACHEYCFLFIFIRNIFHNVLNSAIKNFTEIVQNERFHNHIFPKSVKLCFINSVIFNQLILADVLLFQCCP